MEQIVPAGKIMEPAGDMGPERSTVGRTISCELAVSVNVFLILEFKITKGGVQAVLSETIPVDPGKFISDIPTEDGLDDSGAAGHIQIAFVPQCQSCGLQFQ